MVAVRGMVKVETNNMDNITQSKVKKTLDQQKRAKRLAYSLLLYLIVVTVTVVWLGISNFNKGQELEQLERELHLCGLDVVVCPGEQGYDDEPVSTTNASWYDYELVGVWWSKNHRTTASRDFPRGTMIEVTNLKNGKSVDVLVNDYGPDESIRPDRELDLSSFAFEQIADLQEGLVEVEYQAIGQGDYYPLVENSYQQ